MTQSDIKLKTPKDQLIKLYSLMKDIHNIFCDLKIQYFADRSTALGILRYNSVHPWEDDICIGLMNDSMKIFIEKAMILLLQRGYNIQFDGNESYNIFKVFIPGCWTTIDNGKRIIGTPTVDIYEWTMDKNIITFANIIQRAKFTGCFWNKTDLFPLKLHTFGPIEIYGGNNIKGFCDAYYKSWKTEIELTSRHPFPGDASYKTSITIDSSTLKDIKSHKISSEEVDNFNKKFNIDKKMGIFIDTQGFIIGLKKEIKTQDKSSVKHDDELSDKSLVKHDNKLLVESGDKPLVKHNEESSNKSQDDELL